MSKSGKVRQGPEHLPRPRESFQDGQSGWTNYQGLISSLCSSRKAFLGLGRVSLTTGRLVRHYNSGASLYGDQCLMACVYQWTTSLTVTNTSQVSKAIVILVEFIDHVLPVLCSEHVFVIIDFLILHPHSRLGQDSSIISSATLCKDYQLGASTVGISRYTFVTTTHASRPCQSVGRGTHTLITTHSLNRCHPLS